MSNHTPVSAASTGRVSPMDEQLQAQHQEQPQPRLQDPSSDIISEIHEQSVPEFASTALDCLQGSLYASLKYWQLCEPDQTLPHTWVGYRRGEIVGVLLFRIKGKRATVLSEVIVLDQPQIDAFSRSVFAHFPRTRHISFNAVSLQLPPCSLPSQYFSYSENYVLSLPDSNEAYLAALGKSTRQSVRGYGNRLQRDFPDFSWTAYACDALTADQQRDLVLTLQRFKRDSMTARGKSAAIDAAETQRLLVMASECGLFGVGRTNGRVCAGALSCRIGDCYVMLLSASDPAMSAYRLGMLTCLWSVSDCIAQGARQCHLLWGRYQYKHQLLAVPKLLYRMTVYPSAKHMLLQPLTVLLMFFQGHYGRCIQWLRDHLARKKYPGMQWISRRLRSLTLMLRFIQKNGRWMRRCNAESDAGVSATGNLAVNSTCNTVSAINTIGASGAQIIGTADESRCPIRPS